MFESRLTSTNSQLFRLNWPLRRLIARALTWITRFSIQRFWSSCWSQVCCVSPLSSSDTWGTCSTWICPWTTSPACRTAWSLCRRSSGSTWEETDCSVYLRTSTGGWWWRHSVSPPHSVTFIYTSILGLLPTYLYLHTCRNLSRCGLRSLDIIQMQEWNWAKRLLNVLPRRPGTMCSSTFSI